MLLRGLQQCLRSVAAWVHAPLNPHFRAISSAAEQQGRLKSRSVLKLSGRGLLPFLQKLLSSDVYEVQRTGSPLLYSCLLSPSGRYLHDLFLQQQASQGPELEQHPVLLADVDRQSCHRLKQELEGYCLHHQVSIEDVSDSHAVFVRFGWHDAATSSAAGAGAALPWRTDPRLPGLGQRAIVQRSSSTSSSTSSGDGGGSNGGGSSEVGLDHTYRRWRVLHGVAEGDSEMPSGEALPQEYNLDALRGISFTKGCFVGQEFLARVHAKGVVHKRLMPFRMEGQAGAAPEAEPTRQLSGKAAPPVWDVYDAEGALTAVGRVRVIEGDAGLAVVRLKQALAAIAEGEPLYLGAPGQQKTAVRFCVPDWWPASYLEQVEAEEQ